MRFIKTTLLFILLVALLPLQAQKNSKKPNPKEETWLWEISGNGLKESSYLFGTMHILCPQDFFISDNLLAKFNKSKQLVLEVVDADNPMNALAAMEKMIMKGTKLDSLYTEEEYAEVKNFFRDSMAMEVGMFSSFNPMFFYMAMLPKLMGCEEFKQLESELTKMARKQGKDVKDVETLEYQLSLFDTIPYHVQARELLRLVREWNKEKAAFAELVQLYKNQEFSKSSAFIHANMGNMVEYRDVMLENRNRNWIPKIKVMAAEKSTFFAFGAGHLGGDAGLIELLRKEGYTVTPLEN